MNLKKHFFQKYELLFSNDIPSIVGLGANSAVQLAMNQETEKLVAVKKIYRKLATKESSIHSQFNHPNIVQFEDSFLDTETNSSFIVLEYLTNGTLLDCMNSHSSLKQHDICKIFIGICKGLKAVHEKQVIHRDIKPANILFDEYWNTKICDFGNAIQDPKANEVCGTLEYMAPEILCQKEYDNKVDIWAIGIMLYEVLEGKLPFCNKNIPFLLKSMREPLRFEKNCSRKFIEIIEKILRINSHQRPELSEIIKNLEKLEEELLFNETNEENNVEDSKKRFKTNYESQNSTVDELDGELVEKMVIKKDGHQLTYKSQGVISLKNFRPLNENKKIPNIIIHKPLNESLFSNFQSPKNVMPVTEKVSIKKLLKRRIK